MAASIEPAREHVLRSARQHLLMAGVPLRRVYRKMVSILGAAPSSAGQRRSSYVYVVDLRHGQPIGKTLRRLCPGGYYIQPMIDRDGSFVTFWGTDHVEPGYHVWTSRTRGSVRARLTHGPSVNGHPYWFPDGRRIVFFSTEGLSNASEWTPERQFDPIRLRQNLWIMARDGGARQRLTEGPHVDERPCVSPDGQEIVFVSNRSGSLNLWRVSADGTGLRPVTKHSGVDYRPVFSPDGSSLAYFTVDRAAGSHVLAIRPWPDGDPQPFQPARGFAWLHGPFWSADGKTLLVHGARPGDQGPRLWLINLESGAARALNVPRLKTCSHGSWNAEETVLACDSHTLIA